MKYLWIMLCLMMVACASPFPDDRIGHLIPVLEFEAWRDAGPSNAGGKSDSGLTVIFGGEVIQATKSGKGYTILVAQYPIVRVPEYHLNKAKRNWFFTKETQVYEFAFSYAGPLELVDVTPGTPIAVLGTTTNPKPVYVKGIPHFVPFMIAECIAILDVDLEVSPPLLFCVPHKEGEKK